MKRPEKFLTPISENWPEIEHLCIAIVAELGKRNFDMPDISILSVVYAGNNDRFRKIYEIAGSDLRLRFDRQQGNSRYIGRNDTAGISSILIPGKELLLDNDRSEPKLILYIGHDWEGDKAEFWAGHDFYCKRNNKPKKFLFYVGRCNCYHAQVHHLMDSGVRPEGMNHTHRYHSSPFLAHSNNMGGCYDPEGDELQFMRTDQIMNEFTDSLEKFLGEIKAQSIPEETIDPFPEEEAIPYPQEVGPIFFLCDKTEYRNIECLKSDNPPDWVNNFGLSPEESLTHPRSVIPGTKETRRSSMSFKAPLCGGLGEVNSENLNKVQVFGEGKWEKHWAVIQIRPNRANDIYIWDHAPLRQFREDVAEKKKLKKPRDYSTWLSDEEGATIRRLRNSGIIPITEYKGDFKAPVVLIARELDLDEVEIVGLLDRSRWEPDPRRGQGKFI